jgi:hypothetical protein
MQATLKIKAFRYSGMMASKLIRIYGENLFSQDPVFYKPCSHGAGDYKDNGGKIIQEP